ncbi:cactin-like isoform X1 [Tachysurus ichikawai]
MRTEEALIQQSQAEYDSGRYSPVLLQSTMNGSSRIDTASAASSPKASFSCGFISSAIATGDEKLMLKPSIQLSCL